MGEKLDIFDQNEEKTGESETDEHVHLNGLLHRTVHVWLVNSKKQILLQKRSKNKRIYPGCWDISAAGHINSGETSLQAATRETKEELGISLPESAFKFLTTIKQPTIKYSDNFIDNEFNDIYLVNRNFNMLKFILETNEVEEMKWVNKEEFERLINTRESTLAPHYKEYKILLSQI